MIEVPWLKLGTYVEEVPLDRGTYVPAGANVCVSVSKCINMCKCEQVRASVSKCVSVSKCDTF